MSGTGRNENFETADDHFVHIIFGRNTEDGHSAADSGQRIRACDHGGSVKNRNSETASGKRCIIGADRDYAGYVYSGGGRADDRVGSAPADLRTGGRYHSYHDCDRHGSHRCGNADYDKKKAKEKEIKT